KEWTAEDMTEAVELLQPEKHERRTVERWSSELASFEGAKQQLESIATYHPVKDRVLHVLTNSLPHTPSGYAQRSHSIMVALRNKGWDVSAVTRIGWPITTGALLAESRDVVEGIGSPHRCSTHRLVMHSVPIRLWLHCVTKAGTCRQ